MLEIRPNCEICDKDLPPDSTEARICSYERTYCANCAKGHPTQCLPNLWWWLSAASNPS